jgi:hypothetical protein
MIQFKALIDPYKDEDFKIRGKYLLNEIKNNFLTKG